MKMLFLPVVLVVALATACSTTSNISDVTGKEWKLIEVYLDGKDTLFNRSDLPVGLADGFFVLNMDLEVISGRAAPNLYSGPYTLGDKQSISVMPMRTTMMASFYQNDKLSEHDYVNYVQNAYKWNLVNGNREFLSKNQSVMDVKLVFSF